MTGQWLFVSVRCKDKAERITLLLISFSKVIWSNTPERRLSARIKISMDFQSRNYRKVLVPLYLYPRLLFYSCAFASFANFSLVGLRRQTVQQIRGSAVWLNDILHRRHANRKENSGTSALKTTLSQGECFSMRPLKCSVEKHF